MLRLFAFLIFLSTAAQPFLALSAFDEIDVAADRLMPKVIEWRRHLHRYPELGNREVRTAKYIEDHLRRLKMEVKTGIAKTGVVGILRGGQPGRAQGSLARALGMPG